MYKIIFSPQAQRKLKNITKETHKTAIALIIEDLKDDPHIGKELARNLSGRHTYKIGVYRVIYKIYEKERKVQVISVGHRATVYN